MIRFFKQWPVILTVFTLSSATLSCSHQPTVNVDKAPLELTTQIQPPLLTQEEIAKLPNASDIFRLSDKQLADFQDYYQKQLAKGIKPHKVVANYMQGYSYQFNYMGKTFIATDTLSDEAGNCMSLAVLTTALAKSVNLEIDYKLVISEPIFSKESNVVTYSRHVQSRIFEREQAQATPSNYIVKPHVIIDYFPNPRSVVGQYINSEEFLSLYYQNVAAEALFDENLDLAYYYAYQAYSKTPKDSASRNLMAVMSRRLNLDNQAEAIYNDILAVEGDNLFALHNYHALLLSQQRQDEAKLIEERFQYAQDPNPFYLMALGDEYLASNDLHLALKYYDKAIDKAPYLVEPYQKAIKIFKLRGKSRKQWEYLAQALNWIDNHQDRSQLKYKVYGRNTQF